MSGNVAITTKEQRSCAQPVGPRPERTRQADGLGRYSGILRMQRMVGNHAVNQIIQTKLTVSAPGDRFEQEADRVADQMVRTMPATPVSTQAGGSAFQRKCDSCASGSGKCESCAKEEVIQLKPISSGVAHSSAGSALHGHEVAGGMAPLHGGGSPLSSQERAFFEPRLGRDLGQVLIHNDATAAESARSLSALAYTNRNHIVFGAGLYAPQTTAGKRLLAHELVHVVQQSDGASSASAHIQREPDPRVHPSTFVRVHNREKASTEVEAIYRRGGLVKEADAVRLCREAGQCDKILTEAEAWALYRSGRDIAGLAPSKKDTGGPTAGAAAAGAPLAAGVLAPAAQGGAAATEGVVVKTALERAAVQWGTEAAVLEGGGAAVAAESGTAAAVTTGVEAGAAVAVGEILLPVVAGVALVVAIVDLASYSSFQSKLHAQGFVILPAPLACAIANCHQPTAPTFRPSPFPTTPTGPGFPFGKGPLSEADRQAIEKWLGPQAGPKPAPSPSPAPIQAPIPDTQPKQRGKYTCFGRSFVLQIPNALPEHKCPDVITQNRQDGPSMSANDQATACVLAKHAFNAMMPRGCRPKHLKCVCTKS